ncbi:MAG: hypothetical protein E6J28_02790 [Chloroflexi bacterium]|nr:MAG: hypothetical protein E6J28_02790 [Chloroflexota bacterium]
MLLVICLVGAFALVVVKPRTYEASALLFVDERHNSSQGFDLALQAAELMSHHYLEMATSREVLQAACSSPDASSLPPGVGCDPASLAGKVRADTVRGTSLISITVSSSSPAAAAALANAIANALVAQDQRQVAELLAPTKTYLDSELDRLSKAIKDEKSALPAGGSSPALTALESEYSATYARRQDIALEEYRLAGSLSVVETAQPPAKPADPDPVRYLLVGLVAGLALALVAVLMLEYFDERVREPEDLARAAGTPLVVMVPRATRRHAANRVQPYSLAHAGLLAAQPRLRRVLVAASSPRDHAEVAARGLAAAATEGGQQAFVEGPGDEAPRATEADELKVIAAPSPDVSSRALNLAGSTDLAILVATAGRTRFGEARRTAEMLRQAGSEVAVGILLPPRRRRDANGKGASK